METNKILTADVLDILFDGRNKEYGAYTLRKTYNNRMGKALMATGGFVLVLFCFGFVRGRGPHGVKPLMPDSVTLVSVPDPPPVAPPLPPPVVKAPPPVAMKIFMPPVLVKDPPDDEKPPVVDDLEKVKIGTVNTPGGEDNGVVPPPAPLGANVGGVVEKPKEEDDAPYTTVQIESSYPGGLPAWARFLNKNFRYPDAAQNDNIQGTVMVRFIVDKEGDVSDVEALSGPDQDGLREEAVRVIRKSGKWIPAVQNGRNVKSYKRQPVIFRIAD